MATKTQATKAVETQDTTAATEVEGAATPKATVTKKATSGTRKPKATQEVVCATCGKAFGEKQPRSKNEAGQPIHIFHLAQGSTPTKAKTHKPCRWCVKEGKKDSSTSTFFVVGTAGMYGQKAAMVNTYLCLEHLNTVEWRSTPRFVGTAPEGYTPKMEGQTPTPTKASSKKAPTPKAVAEVVEEAKPKTTPAPKPKASSKKAVAVAAEATK